MKALEDIYKLLLLLMVDRLLINLKAKTVTIAAKEEILLTYL